MFYFFIPILFFLLFNCDGKKTETEKLTEQDTVKTVSPEKDTIVKVHDEPKPEEEVSTSKLNLTSEDKTLLHKLDTLSLNMSYKQIQKAFSGVKELKPEGGSKLLAEEGLTEARIPVKFLKYPGEIEFNFKKDSLYSYYITASEQDPEESDKLFQGILDYYTQKHGPCVEEKVEEETHYYRSCSWDLPKKTLVLSYNVNTGIISWGYQETTEI